MQNTKDNGQTSSSGSAFSPDNWSSMSHDILSALTPDVRDAVERCWRYGVPPMASALHARWWQFETWIRSLVHVELRAAKGAKWSEALRKDTVERQQQDEAFRYMATPDAQAALAYADAADLFRVIDTNWKLFESSLLAHSVWSGNVVQLLSIRNRIGHCRRPHMDDLSRLQQTLRDMEAGAMTAVSSFNRQFRPGILQRS